MNDFEIAIFSYNRGSYLKNCVDSIIRNMPTVRFSIYDDGSTDPETKTFLKSMGASVIFAEKKISDRHGGFYKNMQSAINDAKSKYLLLLQDDMQVVRKFNESDFIDIENIFSRFVDASFLSPVFLRSSKREFFNENYSADDFVKAYIWNEKSNALIPGCYADVSIAHIPRLRAAGWVFQSSESANSMLAKEIFGRMPQFSNPFTFYLPEETAYREKILTLGAKLAFKLNGGKIKNFLDLEEKESEKFLSRKTSILPYAEDFIRTVDPKVRKPYKFNGYRKSWFTLILNKVELVARKLIVK